ncbi:MAG: hypothetical protein OEY00_07170 [Gammaproteobacteria bacterium]|nr:hypothetical protein [Gammaproteobacteria bacterium]
MTKESEYPDWVQWLAQDADGQWWGYEQEPLQYHAGWYENEVGRRIKLGKGEENPDWENSLQRVIAPSASQ